MLGLFAAALSIAACVTNTRNEVEKAIDSYTEKEAASIAEKYRTDREQQIQKRVDRICAQRLSGKTIGSLDEYEELLDVYGDNLNDEDYIVDNGVFDGFLFADIEQRVEQ